MIDDPSMNLAKVLVEVEPELPVPACAALLSSVRAQKPLGERAITTALAVVQADDCPVGVKYAYAQMVRKLGNRLQPEAFLKLASNMRRELRGCPFLRPMDIPLLMRLHAAESKGASPSASVTKEQLQLLIHKNALNKFGVKAIRSTKRKRTKARDIANARNIANALTKPAQQQQVARATGGGGAPVDHKMNG